MILSNELQMKFHPGHSSKLVVIAGPTASGKTALAIEVAKRYNGEVIAADSRTIYRGFDIGTAKPSLEEQFGVPHHLLDIRNPGENYSAADFQWDAEHVIDQIRQRGHLPIIVGGTGLYIDALLFGYTFRSQASSKAVDDFDTLSTAELSNLVAERYADAVPLSERKNRQRLIKILRLGPAIQADRQQLKIDGIIVAKKPEMPILKQKIAIRVDEMLNNGFIQEVEKLINQYGKACPQLSIIGYRHAVEYLSGRITLDELRERFTRDDYQLARRQMTWLRRNPYIVWCESDRHALEVITDYLSIKD